MLLALRLASMSGVATVYATNLPSGEICGSATRCILIMSSKVMGCFAVSCAAISNPNTRTTAQTRPYRRKMRFMLSPLKLQVCKAECLAELRMMSRFPSDSKSAAPRPEPIGERERGRRGDDEEFAAVHTSDEDKSN